MIFEILSIVIGLYLFMIMYFNYKYPEIRWDWDTIQTDKVEFPEKFIWGTATAAHQVEGNCINNWSEFEKGSKPTGEPNIKDNQQSGLACDHWNRYLEDISLIKKLGVSYYRFSVEWSKIQPEQDVFDEDVLSHYLKMIDALLENDITPVLTLHHFTHPIWFDRLGAFEREENIQIFVSFCERVFKEYSSKVSYWCTINEPGVVATQGYFSGMFPPGKKDSQLSAVVLKNLLDAHVKVYHALKKMEHGPQVKIGLVKNINQFEPWRRWHLLDWVISNRVNHFYNDSTIEFLRTGIYKIRIPGLAWIYHKNVNAMGSIDFFGLNYYSHNHLKMQFSPNEPFIMKYPDGDILTDMPYTIYGEGLYRAIESVSVLNVPIIITENGVADARDDRRKLYIKRYLYAVSKAVEDGFDIHGYFYWSLMDNFEWAFGYDMKFGLYEVDYMSQKRTLRDGSQAFIDIVKG